MAGSSPNTLREFLISLGFKVDEGSGRRWIDWTEEATRFAVRLGTAATATAAAVEVASVKIASGLEKMYWASQRTGASVAGMKSFDYAVSQLGGSVEGAQQSLEGFANFLRSNPAALRFVEGLGVHTTDELGRLRDTADILSDVGERLRRMPYWQAKNIASFLGIDEQTLLAMTRGLGGFREQYERMLRGSGVDIDEAARKSTQFMQSTRQLVETLELFGLKVFSELLDRYGPRFEQWVNNLAQQIPDIVNKIEQWIDRAIKLFDEIDRGVQSIGGWKVIIEAVLALKFAGWAAEAVSAIGGITAAFVAMAAAGAAAVGFLGGKKLNEQVEKQKLLDGDSIGTYIWGLLHGDRGSAQALGRSQAATPAAAQALAYFQARGWSAAQAAGIVANLLAESALDPDAVNPTSGARGIAQWLGSRVKDFQTFAGHGLQGSSLMEQLAFIQYELTNKESGTARRLRYATDAGQAASVFDLGFERNGLGLDETARRAEIATGLFSSARLGGGASAQVNVTQNTTIKIDGAGEPRAVGAAVAGEQARVNADLTRTLRTAVQ